MEYFVAFARAADVRLRALGYSNFEVRAGDGGQGWPEGGTFDVIIGSAAAPRIPEALVAQLAPGGRLVMPVGADTAQELVLLTRQGGDFVFRPLLPVRFVPLLGPS
jgi:protein-L-isoaspartate(D-aspartate) O-methyltransferase